MSFASRLASGIGFVIIFNVVLSVPGSPVQELAGKNAAQSPSSSKRPGDSSKPGTATGDSDQNALRDALRIPDLAERQAALIKFIKDFPDSAHREQAAFNLLNTFRDPRERMAAEKKFIADFPSGIYRNRVFANLLDNSLAQKPMDEPSLIKFIDEFLITIPDNSVNSGLSERSDAYAYVAERLTVADVLLDKAADYLQKALLSLSADSPPAIKARYLTAMGRLQLRRKRYADAEENLQKAIAATGARGSVAAYLSLGRVYEAQNNDKAALEAFLNAAAIGNTAEARSSLEAAYVRINGNLAGLHERLDAVLLARPKPFDPGHFVRGKNPGPQRTVLTELFTGSECPPCIAANLAVDGLIDRYDRDTLVVLEYHLHVPRPDPMTNPDSENRAHFYRVSGTPMALIDGIDQHRGGGYLEHAAAAFEILSEKVEARVGTPAAVELTGLALSAKNDTVTVSGEVRALPGTGVKYDKTRLRLALAEKVVHFTGGNGMHFHHFVVRKFLGPPDGIVLAPSGERKKFVESARLADIQSALRGYLEDFEKENSGFQFVAKPAIGNSAAMAVIAFVQNDDTHEVLQSSFAVIGP